MFVWACISPHGSEVIPALDFPNRARMACTQAAMEELGRRCAAAAPDTIIVLSPHWVTVDGHYAISVMQTGYGQLDSPDGSAVNATFDVDRTLALRIAKRAAALGVPIAGVAAEADGSPTPSVELDWGSMVPLWFMGAAWPRRPRIVVACPCRTLSRDQLVAFGAATAECAAAARRRVALICSADQGHGHDPKGRYGFTPISADYDKRYVGAVESDDLGSLLQWDQHWIDSALTDSFWQTLSLHGAISSHRMRAELLSYEAPTYFGMLCAAYSPI